MADDQLVKLLTTQQSLTEWLQDIQHSSVDAFRREDNDKRERLRVLNHVIGLPFDRPVQFAAADLAHNSPELQSYVQEHGNELCALRIMPLTDDLPKLRMRGKSVRDALAWFHEQKIDASKYRADFIPHPSDYSWATIFIINQHGIQGEIIYGGHYQLTQGFYDDKPPYVFGYDFKTWKITPQNDEAISHLQKLADYLHVSDPAKQSELEVKLGATFAHDYLEGYFESTDSSLGTWFIDYSPMLGKMYADAVLHSPTPPESADEVVVSGMTGSPGAGTGPVRIIDPENIDTDVPEGFILVCHVTTPKYVPLMQKAAAIVTDQGGILSHAAIVARELKKPCIVGAGNATKLLKDGKIVSVDASAGTVTRN